MDVISLKGYGVAASDAEGGWSSETKKKLRSLSSKVVLSNLSLIQKFSLTYHFIQERKRAKSIDLASIRAKGMTNEAFLSQQLEYLALFSALKKTVGYDDAQNIALRIMDATAREALLASAPSQEEVRNIGDPFDVYKSYFEVMPDSARKAGCHEMSIYENSESVFQFDIHYCVWFELAKLFEVPEACIPNCYADDLAYPDYFDSLGIKYSRTGTLAKGSTKCDFRFERK